MKTVVNSLLSVYNCFFFIYATFSISYCSVTSCFTFWLCGMFLQGKFNRYMPISTCHMFISVYYFS